MAPGDVERLRGGYEAWNRNEIERIPDFFHPDVVFRTNEVFPGVKPVYNGHEGVAEFWRTMAEPFEFIRVELQEAEDRGGEIVARVKLLARGAGSGVDVTLDLVHRARFEDGRIIEFAGQLVEDEDRGSIEP